MVLSCSDPHISARNKQKRALVPYHISIQRAGSAAACSLYIRKNYNGSPDLARDPSRLSGSSGSFLLQGSTNAVRRYIADSFAFATIGPRWNRTTHEPICFEGSRRLVHRPRSGCSTTQYTVFHAVLQVQLNLLYLRIDEPGPLHSLLPLSASSMVSTCQSSVHPCGGSAR
jgi:hypothetical protein